MSFGIFMVEFVISHIERSGQGFDEGLIRGIDTAHPQIDFS
jgi:hypothetical protein